MQSPIDATAYVTVLAALALLPPGRFGAGPSDRVSDKMTMATDNVTEGLRKYRKEKDPQKRLVQLQKLAATRDPRVALALVDAADNSTGDDLDCESADVLWWYYASPGTAFCRGLIKCDVVPPPKGNSFRPWWKANEVDIRRRAARLAP